MTAICDNLEPCARLDIMPGETQEQASESGSIVYPDDVQSVAEGSVVELMEIRQARYVALLGQGWAKREAARESGYSAAISQRPQRIIETAQLRAKAQSALKRQGATMDKAARVVSEAMNANVVATFEGKAIESVVPDHKTRVQAAKVTADLMGLTERADRSQQGSTLTLTIGGALAERIAERMAGRSSSEGA
jgi:hypothetical protein